MNAPQDQSASHTNGGQNNVGRGSLFRLEVSAVGADMAHAMEIRAPVRADTSAGALAQTTRALDPGEDRGRIKRDTCHPGQRLPPGRIESRQLAA